MLFLPSTKIQATFEKHKKCDISGVFVVFATIDKNIFAALVLNIVAVSCILNPYAAACETPGMHRLPGVTKVIFRHYTLVCH